MSAKTEATEAVEIVPAELAEHWMTMEEACQSLLRTRFTISRLCKDKVLEKTQYGRYVLISRDSIAKYLRQFIPMPSVTTSGRRRTR